MKLRDMNLTVELRMKNPLKCWRADCQSSMGHSWQWISPSGAHSLQPAGAACPMQRPPTEPSCNAHVETKKQSTGNSWKVAGATSLSSLSKRVEGGATKRSLSSTASPQHSLVQLYPCSEGPRSSRGAEGGEGCWRFSAPGRLPFRSSRHRLTCGVR